MARTDRCKKCLFLILFPLVVAVAPSEVAAGSLGDSQASAPKADQAGWSQKVRHFVELSIADPEKANGKEILAPGRKQASAALLGLLRTLPPSDPFRFQVAYTLAILNLEYRSSRAVLLEYCRPGKETGFHEDGMSLLFRVYQARRDRSLLNCLLEMIPSTDGAGAEAMEGFLASLARQTPRELLVGMKDCARPIRQHIPLFLASRALDDGKSTRQAYPLLAQIAHNPRDPLQSQAKQLLKETDDATKRIKQNRQQARRYEELRLRRLFPLVPPGLDLPAGAGRTLGDKYPDWHIMRTSGFDKSVTDSIRSRFGENAAPQICRGDFDGNHLEDIALLIRANVGAGTKLITLRQSSRQRWLLDELSTLPFNSGFQEGYSKFSIYITPRSSGNVEFWPGDGTGKTGRLELKNDGIELNYEGKASVLYYWNGKGYSQVQTGD